MENRNFGFNQENNMRLTQIKTKVSLHMSNSPHGRAG